MKKPIKKKYPSKPKQPKGGIKTENQLKAFEQKANEYNKKCAAIDAEFDKKMKVYNDFQKKVAKAKQKLS